MRRRSEVVTMYIHMYVRTHQQLWVCIYMYGEGASGFTYFGTQLAWEIETRETEAAPRGWGGPGVGDRQPAE